MELNSVKEIEQIIDEKSMTDKEILEQRINEILKCMPQAISGLIEEGFLKKRIPKEYLLTSILFAYSSAIGLSINIKALGYSNYGNLYLALVGRRGTVKSPAMDLATQALNEYDNYHYNNYQNEKRSAANNDDIDVSSIKRKRILYQNATIESVLKGHHDNPYSVGLFRDEGYSFLDNMRNNSGSRDGLAWREFLLQGNTNKHADITRATTESFRTNKTCPTFLASIQDEFMKHIMSGGILESGMVDSLLYCSNFTTNSELSGESIDEDIQEQYNNSLKRILALRDENPQNQSNNIEPFVIRCNPAAEQELHKYVQGLINKQKDASDLHCGYLAKMQINIHKIILLIHVMDNLSSSNKIEPQIEIDTVQTAIKVCDFYYLNFQFLTNFEVKGFSKEEENKIIKIGIENKFSMESIAKLISVNKSTISRRYNRILKSK
jgi:hypothetical protein